MKRSGLRITIFFLFQITSSLLSSAQDITGIWKGYFKTDDGEQYKLEFQVSQKGNLVPNAVSYSYLDVRFYGKSTMKGNFSKSTKTLSIEELRTVEVQSSTGGGTCLMNYKLVYSTSGKESFLEGTYLGKSENRADPKKNGKWGDCGGGTVFLRRVETSDFYVEPFLKEKPIVKAPASTTLNKPVAKTTPKTTPPVVKKTAPMVAKATPKTPATTPQKKVTNIATAQPEIKAEPKKVVPKAITIPQETRSRQNETAKILTVNNTEVTVKLYDNGEVDGDTISVYLDDQLILSRKGLTTAPITLTIKLDDNASEHTLVMVAENMGRIPPNTALMVVQDGDNRYQTNLTSTEQKNAMVRFRYQKPAP